METCTSITRSSIPLTEDGYAVLEPDSCMELGYNNTKLSSSKNDDIDHIKRYNQNEGKINALSDHYEVSESFRSEHDHDYEEPYWEPANQEEELMDQLSKLGVPEILAESIEYVLATIIVRPGLRKGTIWDFFCL